ncbi:hypothetical protein ACKFRM_06420 [Corynebacterium sp. YSMAA1_1_D6]|uniref:hypothetical protein n=1 Tax=unclassified Corynebacterium TaxID=2624378 RepID=UPI0025CE80D7|nr:hypothetical protein [Corynebacterium sp.]
MNLRVHPQPAHPPVLSAAEEWPNRASGEVCTAVLQISGMPRTLRPAIERAMARCIRTESEFIVPGDDPLTAQWCTRWHRDGGWDPVSGRTTPAGIGCHQVITGTPSELDALDSAVGLVAGEYGFHAAVTRA